MCRLSTTSSTVETVPRPRSVQRSKPQNKMVLYSSVMPEVELDGQNGRVSPRATGTRAGRRILYFMHRMNRIA